VLQVKNLSIPASDQAAILGERARTLLGAAGDRMPSRTVGAA
jgi:hypothetical protein